MILISLIIWAVFSFGLRVEGQTVFAHFMVRFQTYTLNYIVREPLTHFLNLRLAAQQTILYAEAHIDGFALHIAYNDDPNDESINTMLQAYLLLLLCRKRALAKRREPWLRTKLDQNQTEIRCVLRTIIFASRSEESRGPSSILTEIEASYKEFLAGSAYMMPVSPWFFTKMPGYNKIWFAGTRYGNDYGESHHIGPILEQAMVAFDTCKAPFNYALGRSHDARRQFLPYDIDMYKGGTPAITKEEFTAWYHLNHGRAQLQKEANSSDFAPDQVFYSALLIRKLYREWDDIPDHNVGSWHGSVPLAASPGEVTVDISQGSETVLGLTGKDQGSQPYVLRVVVYDP
ncbi:uncharacterized protein BDR25DRAFT_359792 [Lindgomyces ingoldianus]|uniref:Uncharacterized protein n=1 Tax=Lindgomyces ingoldianus TaxID=673940 RepID=A0ACB6QHQ7_9PLEO|nr:uncharacterized protein BDR25DRAFT_359792 [Lindgomyces ingoldianus]KAF2466464.1 hypothetical protein BDR25DRAFT_359792 [Lindgomyces ingoldianus]